MCGSRPLGVVELGLRFTLCKLLLELKHSWENLHNKMDRIDTGLSGRSTSLRMDGAEAVDILQRRCTRLSWHKTCYAEDSIPYYVRQPFFFCFDGS